MQFATRFLALLALAGVMLMTSGCITLGDAAAEEDSDQPWTQREGWEGAITMPGMGD